MAGVLSSIFDPQIQDQGARDRGEDIDTDGTDGDTGSTADDGDGGAARGNLDGAFESPQGSTETGGPEVVDII